MFRTLGLTALVVMGLSTFANAALTVTSGVVDQWGLTPFTQANQVNTSTLNGFFTIQNDYSPVNYPNGVGHVPSPGGSVGELFDLEQLHVRQNSGKLEILVVAGGGSDGALTNTYSGHTYNLGDMFITLNGVEYGIVTQSLNAGLTAGSIYQITNEGTQTLALQNVSGSYLNHSTQVTSDFGPGTNTVQGWVAPWAVKGNIASNLKLGSSALIETAMANYGGKEDGTVFIQYTIDLASILGQVDLTSASAHIVWGCGNDIIETAGEFAPQTHVVPTPAALPAGLMGLAALILRRNRKAA
ncbi:MAG: hypothetical protein GC162_14190 [Planctomycetes bacterium]|nr:hypothetical protein [Planctomycetota bacterium]